MPVLSPSLNYLIVWGNQGPKQPWNQYKRDLIAAARAWYATTFPGQTNTINGMMWLYLKDNWDAAHPPLTGYPGAVLADTPIGYWRLEDAAGLVAVDSSATNNAGGCTSDIGLWIPRAPTGITGSLGVTCVASEDTRILIPSTLEYGALATGDFTVEWWTQVTAAPPAEAVVIDLRGGAFAMLGLVRQMIDSRLQVLRRNDASETQTLAFPPPAFGSWHYYVFTKTGPTLTIYYDAAFVIDLADPAPPFDLPDKIALGGNASAAADQFSGGLDDVAFYAFALSPAQIAAHYAARV